jgi:hypothetical protein
LGFAGSYLFFANSQTKPKDVALQITPPITIQATTIPTPTVYSNPFATPSGVLTNPFASPSATLENPFGTYQNPFTAATSSSTAQNQSYQNPFESLK